ncbi:MAG: hypothetical protein JSR91_18405 [Proteobacteria bacterium]|nr:hypothetical protein [Pseudomonadota bacterium]
MFQGLHGRPGILLLPNPWDAGTANLLQSLGFEASATASLGDECRRSVAHRGSDGGGGVKRLSVGGALSRRALDVWSRDLLGRIEGEVARPIHGVDHHN